MKESEVSMKVVITILAVLGIGCAGYCLYKMDSSERRKITAFLGDIADMFFAIAKAVGAVIATVSGIRSLSLLLAD